jgi:hypothetical protein
VGQRLVRLAVDLEQRTTEDQVDFRRVLRVRVLLDVLLERVGRFLIAGIEIVGEAEGVEDVGSRRVRLGLDDGREVLDGRAPVLR